VAAPESETPDGFVMPELIGWPLASAQATLARMGFQVDPPTLVDVPVSPVGSGDAPPRPPVKPGAVMAQIPLAGTRVDRGVAVKLTAAK